MEAKQKSWDEGLIDVLMADQEQMKMSMCKKIAAFQNEHGYSDDDLLPLLKLNKHLLKTILSCDTSNISLTTLRELTILVESLNYSHTASNKVVRLSKKST